MEVVRTVSAHTKNELLDSLPDLEWNEVEQFVTPCTLAKDEILFREGETVKHVYFPVSGLVSCRSGGADGEPMEIYAVGHEGLVEPAAILTNVASVTAEVQIPGESLRVEISDICNLTHRTTELPRVLLKYAYSLAVRMVQAVKCATVHTVRHRLILWLLLAQRAHGAIIPCTHDSIAQSLGTRRATVTSILNSLDQEGIIELGRGRITIVDRRKLQGSACDCFELIKSAFEVDLGCDI